MISVAAGVKSFQRLIHHLRGDSQTLKLVPDQGLSSGPPVLSLAAPLLGKGRIVDITPGLQPLDHLLNDWGGKMGPQAAPHLGLTSAPVGKTAEGRLFGQGDGRVTGPFLTIVLYGHG